MVRIVVADSHEVVVRGIRAVFENEPGYQVVAQASDIDAAVAAAAAYRPDVAVIDFPRSYFAIVDATCRIRAASPDTGVLVFTSIDSETLARDVARAGARGYLLKSGNSDLLGAVAAVARRQSRDARHSAPSLADGGEHLERQPDMLTRREREVVQLIADGLCNKEISRTLNLSVKTIESHRGAVIRKLGTTSAAMIVRYAIRNGLVAA